MLEVRRLLAIVDWTGAGGDSNWGNAANWSTSQVPGASDDVNIPAGFASIVHSGGSDTINSLTSSSPFTLSGGTLAVSTTVQDTSAFILSGGTLAGADVLNGTTVVVATNGGTLDGLTLNGNLDMTLNNNLSVTNGLTLNGTAYVGAADGSNWDGIDFYGTQTIGGTGDIVLGGYWPNFLYIPTSATTVTFGPHLTVHGAHGFLGTQSSDDSFVNQGTIESDAGGRIDVGRRADGNFYDAGSLVNQGTLAASQNGLLYVHTDSWSSTGTVSAISGGNVTLDSSGSNSGAITAHGGTVDLDGSWTSSGAIVSTSGGTVDLNNGSNSGSITVTGGTVNFGGTWSDSASPTLAASALSFYGSGTWTAPTLTADAASTVNFNGTFTTNGAMLTATGGGLLHLSGGALLNGAITIDAGSQMQFDGGTLDNFTITNNGGTTWTSGNVTFTNGAAFTNNGTFDDQTDGTFGSDDVVCPVLTNTGSFVKSGGSGTTDLEMLLVNSGTVRIDSGHLFVGCGYVQTNPGPIPPIEFPPGEGPIFDPGPTPTPLPPSPAPPPVFTSFTLTVAGSLIEQIAGHTPPTVFGNPGTDYGELVVLGDVALAGSLQVQLLNGFVPTMGEKFLVVHNRGSNPISSAFAGLPEGALVWAGAYGFSISYVGGDGNDVVLTLTQISSPTTTVVTTDHPAGSVYGQNVTFTATVSASASGVGTPSGSVQFVVDGANYGPVETLAGGTASLSLSSLSAGPHTIAAQYTSDSSIFLNSASDPNFAISVAKAHLTVTADNKTMVYGGSQPALTYQIAGFVNGDTLVTSGVTGTPSLATVLANSHVGTYAITVGIGTLAAKNYDFPAANLVNGSLSITPAVLTVTANNGSRLYLAANPTLTDTITGFVNGDTSSVITGAASLTTAATTSSPVGAYPINIGQGTLSAANYTFSFVNGTLTITAADSIYVLNTTASGALSVSGNAGIKLSGLLEVDSSSSSALQASGNATVTAAAIEVVGGYKASGNPTFSPGPAAGAASVADPLASLPAPGTVGLTNFGSVRINDSSTRTIDPGIYSQISVSGNANLMMNPGIYIIEGGGLTVSGNANVSGTGVFIFNAGSAYSYNATTGIATDGGNFGGITLSGNGKFNLSAESTGTYAGIVIDQARDNTRALSLSGNASSGIGGTIYATNALLTVSGNAQFSGSFVVGTLNLSGNVALTQMAAGSDGAGDVAGIADTLLAGNLYVYVDNSNGGFSPDELARINDAISTWNTLLVPYSVSVVQVSDPSLANIVIDTETTSASGDAADGVLGCYNEAASEITLLAGWNWYAGADATQIGADQYDFQTTVTHELGHALGLGGAADRDSPMYESLTLGIAHRAVTVTDLNIPEPPGGADPQMAAGFADLESNPTSTALTPALSQGEREITALTSENDAFAIQNPKSKIQNHDVLTPALAQVERERSADALFAAIGQSSIERASMPVASALSGMEPSAIAGILGEERRAGGDDRSFDSSTDEGLPAQRHVGALQQLRAHENAFTAGPRMSVAAQNGAEWLNDFGSSSDINWIEISDDNGDAEAPLLGSLAPSIGTSGETILLAAALTAMLCVDQKAAPRPSRTATLTRRGVNVP